MASQNQIRKNPSIPRIRPRFHNRVRSLQSGLAQLCRLRHTATGHMCQCARVGATARRAVDLHPALFSLLCRERVDGCGQSWQHCHMRASVDPAARGSVAQNARPASEVPAAAPPRARTPRSAPHGGQTRHVYAGCVGKDTREEVLLVADSGRALEISSRPRRPAPARPQATVVSRRRAERGSGLRARVAAEQRTCQRPAAGQEERDEEREWGGELARARA